MPGPQDTDKEEIQPYLWVDHRPEAETDVPREDRTNLPVEIFVHSVPWGYFDRGDEFS